MCPACDPRQDADAFNRPLDWDTSRVTDMSKMFVVRCSPRLAPNLQPPPLPCTLCVHRDRSPPPVSRSAARPSPRALPVRPSAQWAKAFNQALSWDTSRVTNMESMFFVRCSPRTAPESPVMATRCVHYDRAAPHIP